MSLSQCRDIGWQRMGPNYDVPGHIRSRRRRTGLLACPTTAVSIDTALREQADIRCKSSVGPEGCSLVLEEAGIGYTQTLEEGDTGWSCKSLTY